MLGWFLKAHVIKNTDHTAVATTNQLHELMTNNHCHLSFTSKKLLSAMIQLACIFSSNAVEVDLGLPKNMKMLSKLEVLISDSY